MTSTITLQTPIEAEYRVNYMGKPARWFACQVIGVQVYSGPDDPDLICLTESDDGLLGAVRVRSVRPVE